MDLKENIEYSEKLIIRLLPGIIHELNSPIQFIHDNLEYIENEINQVNIDKEEIRDAAGDSVTGNRTMNRIIKGLSILSSDFYRPFQDFSAEEVFESALYVTRNIWKYRFILDYKTDYSGISVWCSPFSLILALCCLVEIIVKESSPEDSLSEQKKLSAGISSDSQSVLFYIEAESGSSIPETSNYENGESYRTGEFLINDYLKGKLDIIFEKNCMKGVIKIPFKGAYESA